MVYKILIVDDDIILGETLSELLQEEGYSVEFVKDGETAVEYNKKEQYDLVLLDVRLPGIDGIQTLERIRKIENCSAAVLIISGNITPEIVESALRFDVSGFLKKPFEINELIFKINCALKKTYSRPLNE